MNKQVNFEDNIFILIVRIRMISDVLALDADPELYLEKTLNDIEFIDNTLGLLFGYLTGNTKIIERDELYTHLSDLESQFSQVLSDFLSSDGTISARDIPVLQEKMLLLKKNSLQRRGVLESSGIKSEGSSEPLVSSDELTELLKDL
jgi:hypothetical protein